MQRLQAYRFELRPDGFQDRQMRRFACEVSGVSRQQQEPTEATGRRASPAQGAVGIPVV